MQAFFVLGREPRLSIAEIASVYGSRIKKYSFLSEDILIAEMDSFDPHEAALKLGGSVKYGFAEHFEGTDEARLKGLIANRIIEQVKKNQTARGQSPYGPGTVPVATATSDRVTFSISGYNHFSGKTFGFEIKSLLQKEGYGVRLATSKEPNMSAAAVVQAKLLTKGVDIIISRDGNSTWFGITADVQPYEDQSHRDYDRPARDQVRGMMPVQLARTLLNLALPNPAPESVFLDPFCGEGTVLMEAALLGVKNIIGADIDAHAIEDTRKNLEWLEREIPKLSPLTSNLYLRDARKTPQMPRIDAVVTEPYLGEPTLKPLTQGEVSSRHKNLSGLYADAIRPIANALKKDGILIFTLPAFKCGNKFLPFPKEGLLPVSMEAVALPGPGQEKENLIYKRADQFVGREILIARKK
ncbi:MAG: DNA methyltransferase [bacterium]